jgi:hypothetical protein
LKAQRLCLCFAAFLTTLYGHAWRQNGVISVKARSYD